MLVESNAGFRLAMASAWSISMKPGATPLRVAAATACADGVTGRRPREEERVDLIVSDGAGDVLGLDL